MAQQVYINNLLAALENIASFTLAETWDNVGLMVGTPTQEVTGVLVALDPTENLLDEAQQQGLNVIVTHHPLIFHPLKAVRTDSSTGRFLQKALSKDISVIGCHTNLDVALGGVSDTLALTLGLIDVLPLISNLNKPGVNSMQQTAGFGRFGRFPEPLSSENFINRLHRVLDLSVLAIAGRLPLEILTVAVCGGSGSDLAKAAMEKGAQIYITGEVKHSVARWAEANNFCVIDAGHFATENPAVTVLVNSLEKAFADQGKTIAIRATERQKGPFVFHYMSDIV